MSFAKTVLTEHVLNAEVGPQGRANVASGCPFSMGPSTWGASLGRATDRPSPPRNTHRGTTCNPIRSGLAGAGDPCLPQGCAEYHYCPVKKSRHFRTFALCYYFFYRWSNGVGRMINSDPQTIRDRLVKLERQNRNMKYVAAMVLIVPEPASLSSSASFPR